MVNELRAQGVTENLRIVPVIHKHCFVPCGAGNCNCYSNINDGKFTIVAESKRQRALEEANSEIASMERLMTEAVDMS